MYQQLFLAFVSLIVLGCNQVSSTAVGGIEPEGQTIASPPPSAAVEAATEPVNKHCPIMGGEVTANGGRVEWKGKTVGFCCPGCIPKWNALSDEEKEKKLAEADKSGSEHVHN
ncbi:HMG-box domain-containing protein [Calycomorphotria hydatis]|uniref:YHS domain protein n=1 Tax=Calycomorphotria hydatis TaxID=2528027 RepID=A0A517TE46_9PLAN|nr:HMG-box domain-containing protein [Calycomorphotria hydatis]QDT66644.1 hypothetical protein V22_39150 [Calycomorphotria hydatis]